MSRKIVIYQDAKGTQPAYFGPFVSDTIADQFERGLIEPLEGGSIRVRTLEEYGRNDLAAINQSIRDMRKLPHRQAG